MSTNRADSRTLALLLTLSDALLLASVTAFMTVLPRWNRPVTDGLVLLLWAAIPVLASRLDREWPRRRRAALVLALVVAGALGWRFITLRVPAGEAMSFEVQLALLVFWVSGFLIVQPLTYRLFDALALGCLAIALLERRPLAAPFLALALGSWFTTLSLRHRLFDLAGLRFRGSPLRAGGAGLLAALVAATLGYVLATLPFGGEDVIRGRLPRLPEKPRRIGWGGGIRLGDLGPAVHSAEPFFAVRFRDAAGRSPDPETELRMPQGWLWRMAVFSSFGATPNQWFPEEDEPSLAAGSPPVRLEIELERLNPRADVFPGLYGCSRARARSERGTVAIQDCGYGALALVDDRGQLVSIEGDRLDLGWAGDLPFGGAVRAEHRELPEDPALRASLEAIVQAMASPRGQPALAANQLAELYHESFRYAELAPWPRRVPAGWERLRHFLESARKGDCNYFAVASCMIFRSLGIPARLVQGFVGLDYDHELEAWTVVEGKAHAWTEFHDGSGWRPFDGTMFVASDGPAPRRQARREAPETAAELEARAAERDRRKEASRSLFDRLVGHDEDSSRLAMLLFLSPLVVVLASVVLRASDRRSRPNRGELPAPAPVQPTIAELGQADPADLGDPRSRALALYARLQRRYGRRGRGRRPGETPRRHAARLLRDFEDTPSGLGPFSELIDRCLYGDGRPDRSEIERHERELD
ncbi:MAG: transglutaminase domain-containing protein [Planctomycetes bacterium]|nr:transglutaminase domain-containing protein [Planctomycetota bacterium]